jgi:hypothetical protein
MTMPMPIERQLELGKERVAFRISNTKNNHGTHKIAIDLVFVADESCKRGDSMGFYHNYFSEKHHFQGIEAVATMDSHYPDPYGWELCVDDRFNGSVSMGRAKEIVKNLGPINSKLEKLSSKEGHPDSFIEYAKRLARVLKVSAIYERLDGNREYTRNDNIVHLVDVLKQMIADNKRDLGIGYQSKVA